MGFVKVAEVPEGDSLGFAMLAHGGTELMLQSVKRVRKDVPQFAPANSGPASLFIEVDDFEDTLKLLDGYPIALAERTTFYGMREIGVLEAGGHRQLRCAAGNCPQILLQKEAHHKLSNPY